MIAPPIRDTGTRLALWKTAALICATAKTVGEIANTQASQVTGLAVSMSIDLANAAEPSTEIELLTFKLCE